MANPFRILTINVNGIAAGHYLLQELVYRENCDVVLVQETKIPSSFRWRLPGYRIYTSPGHLAGRGGTAVLTKASITHALVALPPLPNVQATALFLHLGGVSTLVGSVYIPPGLPLCPQEITSLTSFHPSFILGGDFNAKHPS